MPTPISFPAGFPMSAIEQAERRIRDAYFELYGCEPGVEFTRDQARRLLRDELVEIASEARP